MTTATAIDWNSWRAHYDDMTTADQQSFYEHVYGGFPDQRRAKTQPLLDLLFHIDGHVQVIELGGWDGGLAKDVLEVAPRVDCWVNYEICRQAIENTVCEDHRYIAWSKPGFYWHYDHDGDVFVSCHSIEHLKVDHIRKTLDRTHCRWLHIQTPLAEEPRDWAGYPGTHVIEVGWAGLQAIIESRGWKLLPEISGEHARSFERPA